LFIGWDVAFWLSFPSRNFLFQDAIDDRVGHSKWEIEGQDRTATWKARTWIRDRELSAGRRWESHWFDSIWYSCEFDVNDIDESNLHRDTPDDPTPSISTEIAPSNNDIELRVSQWSIISILKSFFITNCSWSNSMLM
jgi:hypothetical protein